MDIDWGSAISTVLTGAVAALIIWLAQRAFPVARWTKVLERDLALLAAMPDSDSAARKAFAAEVESQIARITYYRKQNRGWNRVIQTVMVLFCLAWYSVMVGLVIWSAQLTGDPLQAIGFVPPYLWLCGLLALAVILWVVGGANYGRLGQSGDPSPRMTAASTKIEDWIRATAQKAWRKIHPSGSST
ncbi:hypothetical protein [Curtobacterium sp. ER1/6]|uniref:hypothetical protein n=1 Tax=Curtobacterium sp. ER1/6 TaxID=1891920 RepID=UPI00114CC22B|nr:hypothetical protein [Curtobacterium sp. ER1/6]